MKKFCLLALLFCLFCLGWPSHPGARIIEGVPFFKQERHQCGAVALAAVFAYYDHTVSPHRISRAVYNETLGGALLPDLENYAAGRGFETESGQGDLDLIKKSVLDRKPVIVLIDDGVWLASRPHYIVVFGFNEKGVIVHDGTDPSVLMDYGTFEKRWRRLGNPYLIVHP
ncbi:MAG: cysteine peptidase family C39 domain-containing protein [Desulfobacterales bacterium]|nr:cysteine peptidase family C39 domain-containing protein [Desulfobacteraceae bacterium]MDD3991293.1 cysteine peptidase family C39 domain-containing protein [Desulfobacteraceae bacterium]MDY0311594.1 cysteine peptidase family C39 domain-containing protein [Desulfobacterales bacterium]